MSIEAMKLALEALEIAANGGGVDFYAYAQDLRKAIAEFDTHTMYREGYVNGYAFGEAAAKQKAIAEAEKQTRPWFTIDELNAWGDEYLRKKAIQEEALRNVQRIGQEIEQEPVAWRNAAIRVGEDLCSVGPFGYYDMTAEQWLDWALSVVTVHAPTPQRTWVGLDNDDLVWIYSNSDKVGQAISNTEAKLKEKNALA